MTTLTRWDPFRETVPLRTVMDRLFDESFFEAPRIWERNQSEWSLALDVTEDENEFVVTASLPGITPEDVEITLNDSVLSIVGETQDEKTVDEKNYHLRERRYGSFKRSISLPTAVDAEKVEALHENGVLTLHLPKSEAVKPKKIAVKSTVNGH